MKVLLKGVNVNEWLESKTELTAEKVLNVMRELKLVIKEPLNNDWFECLKQNIAVYKPLHFKCTLKPQHQGV